MTKKALEESESHRDELRKVFLDKEGEITTLREQVRHAKADGKAEFRDTDGFLKELSNWYSDGFDECLNQVKALYPDLNVSQVSLDNVAQTLTRTVDQEDMNEIFEEDLTPNVQDDREAAPKDEHAKFVEDENRPIGKEEELEMVVDKAPPVDQPYFF